MWTFFAAATLLTALAGTPATEEAPAAGPDEATPTGSDATLTPDPGPKPEPEPEPDPDPEPEPPSDAEEEAAGKLLGMVGSTYEAGDHRSAKGFLEKLHTKYPGTQAQQMSTDILRMLAIVDRPIPTAWDSHVAQWFTPDQDLQFERGVVVVLFWEVWCPHCMQELPDWQKRYEAFAPQGLQLVAFTQVTRDATPDKVRGFIGVHGLTFPIAQEDGTISTANAVRSIPSAAVYQNGTVIFRGHPSLITDELLSEWLHTP